MEHVFAFVHTPDHTLEIYIDGKLVKRGARGKAAKP